MSILTIIVKSSHTMMANWWWCIDAILMYNLQAIDGSGPW